MSSVEAILFPLVCSLVFVVGSSLVVERISLWPLFPCIVSIVVGLTTGNEYGSVYMFVGTMFALRALASMANTALD